MAASISVVRAEADAAKAAEQNAKEEVKRANAAVENAEKSVTEARRTEKQAVAKLQVKNEEASRLTTECSSLRTEAALLREKGEASGKVVKALAATIEKLKADLTASEAKHDWSKLQEPVPDFNQDLTLEDV